MAGTKGWKNKGKRMWEWKAGENGGLWTGNVRLGGKAKGMEGRREGREYGKRANVGKIK